MHTTASICPTTKKGGGEEREGGGELKNFVYKHL